MKSIVQCLLTIAISLASQKGVAVTPVCSRMATTAGVSVNVAPDFAELYSGGYTDSFDGPNHAYQFWSRHKRFGFLKDEEGRVILIAKDQGLAAQLISDMTHGFRSPGQARRIQFPRVREGYAYDVTTVVSPLVLRFHDTHLNPGVNCWNICLRVSRNDLGLHSTMEGDFRHWMDSPLSQRIHNTQDLRTGDIIAFVIYNELTGTIESEVHGAVYVSQDLVFSKNGVEETKPARLMDIDELFSMYMMPTQVMAASANRFQMYRMRPLHTFMQENANILPKELFDAYEQLKERELFLYELNSPESELTRADRIRASVKFKPVAEMLRVKATERLLELKQDTTQSSQTKKILKSLWQGVLVRLTSISH